MVNAELPASWSPTCARPLCVYPKVARYNGTGGAVLRGLRSWELIVLRQLTRDFKMNVSALAPRLTGLPCALLGGRYRTSGS